MSAVNTTSCLKLCVYHFWPFIMLKGSRPYIIEGTMVNTMNVIANKLNFCIEYVVPDDLVYGEELPNGTWTGMMGLLTRSEVDMSGVVFSQQYNRAKAVDFSEPLHMNDQAVAYKRPQPEPDIAGFMRPYTRLIWITQLVTLFVVFMCITFVSYYTPRQEDNDSNERVWTATLWTVAAPLAQASSWLPRGDSLRIIAGTWLLMAFILGSVYRSNLKAMLILPKLRLPFNSLEELIESGITTYTGAANIVTQAIQEATPGTRLYGLKKQHKIDNNVYDALRRFNLGLEAVFTSRIYIYSVFDMNFARTGRCDHYIAQENYFGATSLSLAFPKRSPLKERVDPVIRNLKEFGILDHMYLSGMPNVGHCLKADFNKPDNDLRPLQPSDFYGVFCVYAGGILLGAQAFIFELILGSAYN
ncbi:glutamate receptor 2-like [Homarus americanus]|uniref:Glutamate receptor-like 12 n=1 Tax=Homarus americanus TaxID=6706 RepID=A0A8J5JVL6_HOMAM|nr:glutamate receptor 2-like [Homarus americanus]KAG7164985.1 Glutamate receptor-like 12 [Homarus americanus]